MLYWQFTINFTMWNHFNKTNSLKMMPHFGLDYLVKVVHESLPIQPVFNISHCYLCLDLKIVIARKVASFQLNVC